MKSINLLFICSRNQWRSRTAETIFRNRQDINVKSAGTAAGARIRVTAGLLKWADKVYVMEDKHQGFLLRTYPDLATTLNIEVLDIPDEYQYLDEDLVQELQSVVD